MNTTSTSFLLLRAAARLCAIPLAHAGETLRPLPVLPVRGAPPFVLGLSVIRGTPLPVVHLGALLGGSDEGAFRRFVTLRLGDRGVALAVENVVGIRGLSALPDVPPLLQGTPAEIVESIGALDSELLLILRAGRLLPPEFGETEP